MKTKEAIEILARRRTFLEARSTPDMSYDKAEASALELALHAINISGAEAQKIVVENAHIIKPGASGYLVGEGSRSNPPQWK